MVIARVSIYEAEELVTDYCVYELINQGKRKTVIWTSFVEVSEVDTSPLLPILLLYQNQVSYPGQVMGFSNELVLQEFVYFFFKSNIMLRGH